jgi:Lrp/AsnC family leucine-responsive transcriptional regulator
MDRIDAKMLEILQENSRITISDLSKKLSLSRPSVMDRMLKLQEQGIIEEFTARISLPAVGRDTLLFIQLGSLKVSPVLLEDMVVTDPDILECHRITGRVDYFIKAAVSGMDGMRALIDRLIPFGEVNTAVSILSLVPYRHIHFDTEKLK